MVDLIWVCRGKRHDVAMTPKVKQDYDTWPAEARFSLKRWIEIYADEGPIHIPPVRLRSEGCHSVGDKRGTQKTIYAFKDWGKRIYGCPITVNGRSTFVCTETDGAKKKDKANQAILARAARNLAPYL